jgi:hypothetical protein
MAVERSNPHEEAARERKAAAIVVALEPLPDCTGDAVARLVDDGLFWSNVAQRAGVNVPSQATRERVVAILRARDVQHARLAADRLAVLVDQPADPFEGLPGPPRGLR